MEDSKLLIIAEATHEMNRLYCQSHGDDTQSSWKDAPEWQRRSAIAGVAAALRGDTPEQLHDGWCDLKFQEGWTYGAIKDPSAKVHPCLIAYSKLPPFQRRKDTLFRSTVMAMRSAMDDT